MPPKGKKRLGCPICGAALAGKVPACPKCGIKFDEQMHPVCPICGVPLPPKTTKCPKCGTDLKAKVSDIDNKDIKDVFAGVIDELIADTARQVKAEDKRFSCPKCDTLLTGNELRCPKCNALLKGETGYQCPVCGTGVNSDMKRCPHCGISFIEAEEEPKPPEPAKPLEAPEVEVIECPQCGTTVTMTDTHCPHCGAEFEPDEVAEAPPEEAEEILCASCHRPVGAEVSKCPYCGAEFEEGVEEAPEVEEPAAPETAAEVTPTVLRKAPGRAAAAAIAPPAKIEKAFLRLARPVDIKVIIGFAVFGAVLLFLAYSVQVDINALGTPLSPADEHARAVLEGQRNVYFLTAAGCLFLALFGASLPSERVTPVHVLQNQMVSTARTTGDYCSSNALDGNALYLPAKNGLTRERIFIPMSAGLMPPKNGLSDGVTSLSNGNGGVGAVLLEPLGLSLLDHVEGELNIKMSGAGLESVENTLQTLKHDYGLMKDFHFKGNGERKILRVEYGGLANACNAVRRERPETCRQNSCFGCACMLSAAARATGKMVKIESVDNTHERVEFTISLHDW